MERDARLDYRFPRNCSDAILFCPTAVNMRSALLETLVTFMCVLSYTGFATIPPSVQRQRALLSMKLCVASSTPCRLLLQRPSLCSTPRRTFHRGAGKSSPTSKQTNESRKQRKLTDTLLTASRLGRHAASIDKSSSDRYSGWKHTPGPSTLRNVGRPTLSHNASKSMASAKNACKNAETLLGPHSAAVLLKPMLHAQTDDGELEARHGSTASISARDFITPRRELKPGDFVEVRRTSLAVGIVLPPPDDALQVDRENKADRWTNAGRHDLYVLVASGQIVLYKDNDVMMQIPSVIEPQLVQKAVATSRNYVVSSNSLDSPVNRDGSHDVHLFATAGETDPVEGTAIEEEPVDIPRFEARASICNKLRILERQKESELQRLLPSFQSLFLVDGASQEQTPEVVNLKKHRMDLRTGAITTFEAARLMHKLQTRRIKASDKQAQSAFTACTVYAAHALLMSHPTHFLADALSHRTSQLFTCRSDAEKANLALVSGWMSGAPGSEGQNLIDAFCSKASKIRQYSETHPHDASGAPRIIDTPHHPDLLVTWTEQDKSIIEFLQASLGSRREVQEDTHASIAMSIVKRAGGHFRLLPHPHMDGSMDVDRATRTLLVEQEHCLGRSMLETVGTDLGAGSDLQHALVMRFLTSIGALPPWQNPICLDASFRSATMGVDGGEPEREPTVSDKEDVSSAGTTALASKFNLTLDEQVESIRHDFGADHTVYVIDDQDAFELDDGISIETVSGTDQAWVHVHIADPTAWINPDDELGQRAERRFQTLYFPEARWAMLPDEFVRSGIGLRAASSSGGTGTGTGADVDAQRVMTFSALVDLPSGLVQDTKVRPALIHNVETTSYDHVSSLLAHPSCRAQGARSSDLSLLLEIATKLSENRAKSTAFLAYQTSSLVSVSPLPLPGVAISARDLHRPYFFAGLPTIHIRSDSKKTESDGVPALAQFVVSELMVLAGRIAALYGKQHGLAFAYRYQKRPDTVDEANEILSLRTNLPPDSTLISEQGVIGHGLIPFDQVLRRGFSISTSGYSAVPSEHFSLGISSDASSAFVRTHEKDAITGSGYVRATSPLRRYPDMLAHWQIKHHLVHHSARFGVHNMQRLLPQLERQEISAKQWMRSSNRFWINASLQRTLLAAKAETNTRFTARVALAEPRINAATLSARVRVNIEQLGAPADLEWGPSEPPPRAGDVFDVVPVAVTMAGIRSGLTVRRV